MRSSSAAPRPGSAKATPMEAATRTSLPSMRYGWESVIRSRSAISWIWCSRAVRSRPPSPTISAANSSPPSRAAVSPGRTASWSLRAAWTSSSSPAWCPMVSLTALKPSRSMKSTAVSRSEERRPDSAWPTRSVNRARLGRSVSGSCSALCCSWAWRRTRSVTSRLLKIRPPWWRLTVDSTLSQPPVAGPEAALDAGGGLLRGAGGEEAAHLVHHPAQVLGVDQRGELGADQLLGVPAVDPGGGRADVAEDAGRGGDHDDVAGALHQGAEVVLLLGQFLGEGDVVESMMPWRTTRASTTVQPVKSTTRSTLRPSRTL